MRRFLPFLMLAALPAAPALAGGLEKHSQDLSFDFSYSDTDDYGKTTALAGTWTYVLDGGNVEVGGVLAYLKVDLDDGTEVDALAIGPAVIFNFTPEKSATGFVSGYLASVGGDAGDVFDYEAQIAVGIRSFVGDSASVDVALSRTRDFGADFFDDVDTTALTAGLSIFFGAR